MLSIDELLLFWPKMHKNTLFLLKNYKKNRLELGDFTPRPPLPSAAEGSAP